MRAYHPELVAQPGWVEICNVHLFVEAALERTWVSLERRFSKSQVCFGSIQRRRRPSLHDERVHRFLGLFIANAGYCTSRLRPGAKVYGLSCRAHAVQDVENATILEDGAQGLGLACRVQAFRIDRFRGLKLSLNPKLRQSTAKVPTPLKTKKDWKSDEHPWSEY